MLAHALTHDTNPAHCPLHLYTCNTWPHSPLDDPCCYLLLLFMFTNYTWIRSALEWNSDTSTGCLSLTLVRDTYKRPLTISWAFSGNMESNTSLRILEMSKLGCNGPRALERAFVASRNTKLVHSPNKKKRFHLIFCGVFLIKKIWLS